nr:hypothetical protein [Marinicella sp. W31]MDC2876990.1 hypothetical protein [Marinicella sp. W31]
MRKTGFGFALYRFQFVERQIERDLLLFEHTDALANGLQKRIQLLLLGSVDFVKIEEILDFLQENPRLLPR